MPASSARRGGALFCRIARSVSHFGGGRKHLATVWEIMPVGEGAAMNSWLAWIVTAAVAVTLGAVGYDFSLRTLRWVALIIALATAAYLTVYGLTHPGQKPGSLSDEFAWSADMLSTALIRPFSLGHTVPAPGRLGWLAIVVLLVLGYRALEVWALRRQAP